MDRRSLRPARKDQIKSANPTRETKVNTDITIHRLLTTSPSLVLVSHGRRIFIRGDIRLTIVITHVMYHEVAAMLPSPVD